MPFPSSLSTEVCSHEQSCQLLLDKGVAQLQAVMWAASKDYRLKFLRHTRPIQGWVVLSAFNQAPCCITFGSLNILKWCPILHTMARRPLPTCLARLATTTVYLDRILTHPYFPPLHIIDAEPVVVQQTTATPFMFDLSLEPAQPLEVEVSSAGTRRSKRAPKAARRG